MFRSVDAKSISWMLWQCVTNKWLKDVGACFQKTPCSKQWGTDVLTCWWWLLFVFSSHRIWSVCFSSDASSADLLRHHLTVHPSNPQSFLQPPSAKSMRRSNVAFFRPLCWLAEVEWRVEAAGCLGGGAGESEGGGGTSLTDRRFAATPVWL